ncbi:hypothetical protein [Arsenicibacter rosenii]|uniref:NADH dehydrogenase n=1 Tax=Arsenicibacter rosenii TaxID=1750698 RepID=A0A1S2VHS6_9BACT|nr:hypothetical protein [Arsenicibacter rosenii]OIN57418.1 hypothetical protein BLX24_19495 [Arsenicibacter rosenii]
MFTLNPHNLADALIQHSIMLFVAAVIGFMIGYISQKSTIRQLEGELAGTERELDLCVRGTGLPTNIGLDETAVLTRIRARASELNFERIGRASSLEADDLKAINGIGPFLERKLNAIGIYTFQQVANFSKQDIDKINEIIEFFPGRIDRDNWVGQAFDLCKRKN